MDCKEFKTWLLTSGQKDLKNPPDAVSDHLNHCKNCSYEFRIISENEDEIVSQSKAELPEIAVLSTIRKLESVLVQKSFRLNQLSKLAVLIIISGGLVLGLIAGSVVKYSQNSNDTELWDNEFTFISENSNPEIAVFE